MRVGMSEAKTQLSKLVALAEAGEEVVITRSGKSVVRLMPEPEKRPLDEFFGSLEGRGLWIADDFNSLDERLARDFGLHED